MISCKRCEELINARLDDLLEPQDLPLLEDHLAQCPACQKLDRDLTALHERLKNLSFDPPEDFAAAVLSQLEAPQPAKRKKTPWVAVACAAAITLLVVTLSPQMLPFGESADTAAAEVADSAEPPTAESAPEEAQAAPQEPMESAAGTEEKALDETALLTQDQALLILEDYLDSQDRSLDLTLEALTGDSGSWVFTARDPDSGKTFRFTVLRADGTVEEVPLP